jgi:hypothetical protein
MMSNNVAGHIGREYTVEALGQKWTFSRWTYGVWVKLAEWAKTQLPDPIVAALAGIEQAAVKDAEILRKLSLADAAEIQKAQADGRPPALSLPAWKPTSEVLTEKAQELASCYLDFNSRQFRSLITSPVGMAYVMHLLLLAKHPDATPELAYDLFTVLGQEEVGKIFVQVRGESPTVQPKNAVSPAA